MRCGPSRLAWLQFARQRNFNLHRALVMSTLRVAREHAESRPIHSLSTTEACLAVCYSDCRAMQLLAGSAHGSAPPHAKA